MHSMSRICSVQALGMLTQHKHSAVQRPLTWSFLARFWLRSLTDRTSAASIGPLAEVPEYHCFFHLGLVTQHAWHQILNQLNLSAQKWCSGILGLITGKQRGTDHSSSQTWLILQQGIRLSRDYHGLVIAISIEIRVLFMSNSIRMATPGYIEHQLSMCLSCRSTPDEKPLLLTLTFFMQ